jgi:rhodanese-related sulfurtransferase
MQSLQPLELKPFLQAEPHAQLLDVREPWELQQSRLVLPGATALEIRMQDVPSRLHDLSIDQPVVCICHHGMRSAQVVAYLQRQGYTRAYNLTGGIDAWSKQVDAAVPRY